MAEPGTVPIDRSGWFCTFTRASVRHSCVVGGRQVLGPRLGHQSWALPQSALSLFPPTLRDLKAACLFTDPWVPLPPWLPMLSALRSTNLGLPGILFGVHTHVESQGRMSQALLRASRFQSSPHPHRSVQTKSCIWVQSKNSPPLCFILNEFLASSQNAPGNTTHTSLLTSAWATCIL